MTVAIGMVCSDGVIVASDSMGSSGRVATHLDKTRALSNRSVVWVAAGSSYVTQCIRSHIETLDATGDHSLTTGAIAGELRQTVIDAYAVSVAPPSGERPDIGEAEALILGWTDGVPSFTHLRSDTAPVSKSGETFFAIGSGHEYAHVSYASIAHHTTGPFPVEQGLLLAYRIITTVCKVSSWGVAPPVQIAVATADGARVLGLEEIEQIDTGVQRWLTTEAVNFRISDVESSPERDLPAPFEWSNGPLSNETA